MAKKGKSAPKPRSPARAGADAGAAADAAAAGTGAMSTEALMAMVTQRLNVMQTSINKAMDDMRSHTSGVDQTSQFGAISTKQDVGGDESQSAGIALGSDNSRALSNMVAFQAFRFADRDRTHFDNMQVLEALAISNAVFASGLSQNLAAVDAHQQCGVNSKMRKT